MSEKTSAIMCSVCMGLGLTFVTTGIIGYPIVVRSQVAVAHQPPAPRLPVFVDIKEVSDKIPPLNIKNARDPFLGDAISNQTGGSAPTSGTAPQPTLQGSPPALPTFPTLPSVGPTIGNRVPDIAPNAPSYLGGPQGIAAGAALQMSLEAVALGKHPFALVKIDGHDRSITIGDSIAGSRVSSITISSVRLADGRVITYSQIGGIPLPGPNQQLPSTLIPGQLPLDTNASPFPPLKASGSLQPQPVKPITTSEGFPTSQPTGTPERLRAPNCQRNIDVSTTPITSTQYPSNVAPAQPCAAAPSQVQ